MSNRIFNQIIISDGCKKDFLIRHNLNSENISLDGFDFQRKANMYGIPYTIVNNNEILIHFTEPLDKYYEYKITVSTEFIHQIDSKKDKYYIKQYRFLSDEEQKLSDEEVSGLPFEYIHKDEYRKLKQTLLLCKVFFDDIICQCEAGDEITPSVMCTRCYTLNEINKELKNE